MARFFGLAIIRNAQDVELRRYVLNHPVMYIQISTNGDLVIADQPMATVVAMLVVEADRIEQAQPGTTQVAEQTPTIRPGGIGLINTGDRPIQIRQIRRAQQEALHAEQRSHTNGSSAAHAAAQPDASEYIFSADARSLATGEIFAINNETTIIVASTQIDIRLAPHISDRQRAQNQNRPEAFTLTPAHWTPLQQETTNISTPQPVEFSQLALSPGAQAGLEVLVKNSTDETQNVIMRDIVYKPPKDATSGTLPEAAPGWISYKQPVVNLETSVQNKDTTAAQVLIKPPKHFSTRAGEMVLLTRAFSRQSPETVISQEFTVTILPYTNLELGMRQRKLRAFRRAIYYFEIQNLSNWPVPLKFSLGNDEGKLRYRLTMARRDELMTCETHSERAAAAIPVHVLEEDQTLLAGTLPAGATACATLVVTPQQRWPLGKSRSCPFTLTCGIDLVERDRPFQELAGSERGYRHLQTLAESQDHSLAPVEVDAELTHRRIPYWVFLLLLLIVIVVAILIQPDLIHTATNYIRGYDTAGVSQAALKQDVGLSGQVFPQEIDSLKAPLSGIVEQLSVPDTCAPSQANVKNGRCVIGKGSLAALLNVEQHSRELTATLQLLDQTIRDVDLAEEQWRQANLKAEFDLEFAQRASGRLASDGDASAFTKAQNVLNAAKANEEAIIDTFSQEKTAAKDAMAQATHALQEAQLKVVKARREWEWVKRKHTHPTEQILKDGLLVQRPLTPEEILEFEAAISGTLRLNNDADNAFALAQDRYATAQEREKAQVAQAQQATAVAQRQAEAVDRGSTSELDDANKRVSDAQAALDAATILGVEHLDQAAKVADQVLLQLSASYQTILASAARTADMNRVKLRLATAKQIIAKLGAEGGYQGVDELVAALNGLHGLTQAIYASLDSARQIDALAQLQVIDIGAHKGDSIVAQSPILTYTTMLPHKQIIANIPAEQLSDLTSSASYTSTMHSISATLTLQHIPASFDSSGQPIKASQIVTLTGMIGADQPLFSTVTVRLVRQLRANVCQVPARAIITTAQGSFVDVRTLWLGFIPLDKRVGVTVGPTGNWMTQVWRSARESGLETDTCKMVFSDTGKSAARVVVH